MNPLIIIVPLALVVFVVLYGIVRAIGRIWLDHSIRLALLEKAQQKPELLDSASELFGALMGIPVSRTASRQDYAVTGVALALIGIACGVAGRYIRMGRLAVGIYIGGLVCIVLGVLITLAGVLIRSFSRPPELVARKK